MSEPKEDLNLLLNYVLPHDKEVSFYCELFEMIENKESASKDILASIEAVSILKASIQLFEETDVTTVINSLDYMFAKTGVERAKLHINYTRSDSMVQKVYDLRKKYIDQIPILELELCERLK